MARVMVIFGTRPEIIRLSRIIPALKEAHEVILVNTRQNFDSNLSEIFLEELDIPKVNHEFTLKGGSTEQRILEIRHLASMVMEERNPDSVLILGDTYSGLSAISANEKNIPVYHLEAGNRCFSEEVPEEVNRVIIDNNSSFLLRYTQQARANLLAEGFNDNRIFVSGNPILEVINFYRREIEKSSIMERLNLIEQKYLLATIHRAEGVDNPHRLLGMLSGLNEFSKLSGIPVVATTHPRLRDRLGSKMKEFREIKFIPPLGLFNFVKLQMGARLVATDSGTVQEEACILGIPAVTLRNVTERPETVECGSNELVGYERHFILKKLLELVDSHSRPWKVPPEYLFEDVSFRVSAYITETMNAS